MAKRSTPEQRVRHWLEQYLSRREAFPGEAYEFDIRMQRIRVPNEVYWHHLHRSEVTEHLLETMAEWAEEFSWDLRQDFPWIQASAAGDGWLALKPREPMIDPETGKVRDLEGARKLLKDLREIDGIVKEAVRNFERGVSSHDYWRRTIGREYRPRGRKDWDPRR